MKRKNSLMVAPSKFNIVPMVEDTFEDQMDCTPISTVKVFVDKVKGAAHKNGNVDDTCKRSLVTDTGI